MKISNSKLKTLIVSSFLIAVIASAPLVSFAKDNDNNNDNYQDKAKTEQRANVNTNIKFTQNSHSNSIWNRIFGWFGHKANAQTKLDPHDNSSLPPSISGITAPTVLTTGQTGTWKVNASDPDNGTLTYTVDWGEITPLAVTLNSAQTAFVQTSTFTHSYANPGTYKITFTITNDEGLKTTSTATVHVRDVQIQQTPIISNLTATSNKPKNATINWNTDVQSSSLVWFSTISPVDTSVTPNVSRKLITTKNHKINLNKLTPNTTYYVIVGSGNGVGRTLSDQISFTTPDTTDNTTPVITSLTGPSTVVVGDTETVSINAYDPKNDSLTYTADWGDNAPSMMALLTPEPPFVQTSTFSHVYSNKGTYTANFTAENSSGKKTTSTITITVIPTSDTIVPVISSHDNITVDATSRNGAVVVYTLPNVTDDVDATTTATCNPISGSIFPIGITNVYCNHKDSSGNVAVETSFTITVNPLTDTTPPVISDLGSNTGQTSTTITWTTDEPSTSKIFYSTSTPVDLNTSPSINDASLSTSHSLNIKGLTASTLYHFIVESTDASANTTDSSELAFTTSS